MTIPKRRVPFLINDDGSLVQKSWHEFLDGVADSVGGIGTIATQNANNVAITGGTISGTTVSGYVTTSTTVNGKALSGNITLGLASADFANQGTTTTVLHGNAAGNPAFGAVVEADITLADNTTNNVATTKHGFAPKLSNVATEFLNGQGGWTVPAGSGGSGVPAGTSNPGSPSSGDQFFRTDLGLYIYYDGTRWLTVNQYIIALGAYAALPTNRSATTPSLLMGTCAITPTFDFWMETFLWTSYVATTNNGTNFWTITLKKAINPTTQTTIVAPTTGTTPDTASNFVQHNTAIGALSGTTAIAFIVDATKTLSPGNLDIVSASVVGRLVVT